MSTTDDETILLTLPANPLSRVDSLTDASLGLSIGSNESDDEGSIKSFASSIHTDGDEYVTPPYVPGT